MYNIRAPQVIKKKKKIPVFGDKYLSLHMGALVHFLYSVASHLPQHAQLNPFWLFFPLQSE